MSSPLVGSATIKITPQFVNIKGPLNQEFQKGARDFEGHGRSSGRQFGKGFQTSVGPIRKENERLFAESGRASGQGFLGGFISKFGPISQTLSGSGRKAGDGFASGFKSGSKQVETAAEETGRRGGLRFMSGFTSRIGPRAFSASTGVFTAGAVGLAGAARTGALALTGLAVAGVAAGTALGVKTAASMEQATVAFTTLLHSSSRAKSFLGDLSKFAAATPFTLPGLVDASRQLLGVGASASSVIPTLTAWGDTSGALGLTQDQFSRTMIALTQSMANGKIQAGDMLQITQAGIPIWAILSRALGKPVGEVRKLSENGKLLTAEVLPKLQKQMEKDYGGAMAKQAQTLNGIWSTFTDTLNIGLATAVQPLIPALKTGLTGAIGVVGGALKLLPAAGRAIGPMFREIKLGAGALIQSFRDPDITSRGFVGQMERIGAVARHSFDQARFAWSDLKQGFRTGRDSPQDALSRFGAVFQTVGAGVRTGLAWFRSLGPELRTVGAIASRSLVPSFRLIGDFLVRSVVPSVISLGHAFITTLLPAVKPVAIIVGATLLVAFRVLAVLLAHVVGPTLRAVTGFIDRHRVAISAVAVVVGTMVGAFYAYRAVMTVVTIAQRLFTAGMLLVRGAIVSARVAMWLLNTAFAANPIGIVVVALAALAAGFVYAYRHSETFRNIVSAGLRFIANTASSFWNSFLKPTLNAFGAAIRGVGSAFEATGRWFGRTWEVIKAGFRAGVRIVVDYFLGMAGAVINGAARAFGWIPGIGPKLRGAAARFNDFRDSINRALSGVHDRSVTVGVQTRSTDLGGGRRAVVRLLAEGGLLHRFAGGSEQHIAHIAPAGAMRLWAEPETGGEAYIPLAGSKRGRSVQILSAVADRFGMGLVRAANGLIIHPQLSGMPRLEAAMRAFDTRVGTFAQAVGNAVASLTGFGNVVQFAKSIAGTPYVWGGASRSGSDCSGFVGMLVQVARGMHTIGGRLFSTSTLPAGYFANSGNVDRGFRIGWFRGNPGHVAATVNGVGMESRGGDGVVVDRYNGRSAGSNYGYFTNHAYLRLAQGGILPGDPPWHLLDRNGPYYRPGLKQVLQAANAGVKLYDGGNGARWRHGTAGVNLSGEDEFVFRRSQIDSAAGVDDRLLEALGRLERTVAQQGEIIGRIVDGGIRANSAAMGRATDLYVRGG